MVTLYQGDCLEKLKDIEDSSIDMILTDPPYGTTACKWDTVIPFEPMWEQIWRIMKPNGVCALFGSEPFSSHLRLSQIKYFKYDWIWHKDKPSGGFNANRMPMKDHEIVSVFYLKQPTFNKILEPRLCNEASKNRMKYEMTGCTATETYGKITKQKKKYNNSLRNPTTTKFFKCPPQPKRVHPTQKPVDLLEYFIKTYTLENETVLDFTMGSGSTGVAAVNLSRNFVGIELDDSYFAIAHERIGSACHSLHLYKISL